MKKWFKMPSEQAFQAMYPPKDERLIVLFARRLMLCRMTARVGSMRRGRFRLFWLWRY